MDIGKTDLRSFDKIVGGSVVGAVITGVVFAGRSNSILPFLFAVFAALLAVPWWITLRRGELDIFSPPIFLSIFLGFTWIAAFDRVFVRPQEWVRDIVTVSIEEGFILIISAYIGMLVAFFVGYYAVAKPSWTLTFPKTTDAANDWLRVSAIGYMIAGLIFYFLSLYLAVGFDFFAVYDSTTPRSVLFSNSFVLMAGSNMLYLGCYLWIATTVVRGQIPTYSVIALAIITLFWIAYGGRARAIYVAVMGGIIIYYGFILRTIRIDNPVVERLLNMHPAIYLPVLPIAAGGIALLGILAGGARLNQNPSKVLEDISIMDILTFPTQDFAFDNFLAVVELFPEHHDYFYGAFYARTFTHFVPRSIWPDKPVSYSGSWLRRELLPDGAGGRPPASIGEYYMNFGWAGIPLMGLVYGIIMRICYQTLRKNRLSPIALVGYAIITVTIGNSGLQNLVLTTAITDFILLVPVAAGYRWFAR